jgi:hypothetical protein
MTAENEHADRFATCVREMRSRARDRIDPATGAVAVGVVGSRGQVVCSLHSPRAPQAPGFTFPSSYFGCRTA